MEALVRLLQLGLAVYDFRILQFLITNVTSAFCWSGMINAAPEPLGNCIFGVHVERFQTRFELVRSDASDPISSVSCWFGKGITNITTRRVDCRLSSCLQLL